MFTGLVAATGTVERLERETAGYRLALRCELGALQLGESVSVNGACLTVCAQRPGGFTADLSRETAEKTNLGRLRGGSVVNLERALAIGDRVGGHLVSGHVDSVVTVRSVESVGVARRVEIELPDALRPYLAPKGSVALDGVSLTVNNVRSAWFDVMLIPHTLSATTLLEIVAGRELNLEVDLLARYVVTYLSCAPAATSDEATDREQSLVEALKRSGMM